jgi:pyrroline-5-carboxylate reductase
MNAHGPIILFGGGRSTGQLEWLDDEVLIDAATGLFGSGPAYRLHRASAKSAAELRNDVTSPAGATEAGLKVLMKDDLLQTILGGTGK